MSITPSNILHDSNPNWRRIEWKPSGARSCTMASKADGSLDAEVTSDNRKLVYKRYRDPVKWTPNLVGLNRTISNMLGYWFKSIKGGRDLHHWAEYVNAAESNA